MISTLLWLELVDSSILYANTGFSSTSTLYMTTWYISNTYKYKYKLFFITNIGILGIPLLGIVLGILQITSTSYIRSLSV